MSSTQRTSLFAKYLSRDVLASSLDQMSTQKLKHLRRKVIQEQGHSRSHWESTARSQGWKQPAPTPHQPARDCRTPGRECSERGQAVLDFPDWEASPARHRQYREGAAGASPGVSQTPPARFSAGGVGGGGGGGWRGV